MTIELLVREGRFDYRNQRHRRALFEADPEGTFGLSADDPRLEWLRFQAQVHRRDHGRDRSSASWAAMNFGETVRESPVSVRL